MAFYTYIMDIQLYNQEIEAIFSRFPSFQNVGGTAYKPGLETMRTLCKELGNPHEKFRSVHVAGTNGKGSTSHMLAAALSKLRKEDGTPLKVGLYTSPHLLDFRERMKASCTSNAQNDAVSGNDAPMENFTMPSREYVYEFLKGNKGLFEQTGASFFEITTVLAFSWFAAENVDIAVIECGLGGRLDATNILSPELCVITNIGLDHCEYLGSTLQSVAGEKAGIIKSGIPVVIGEKSGVEEVFINKAQECGAPIVFAQDYRPVNFGAIGVDGLDLKGKCQEKNIRTVVAALETLALQTPALEVLAPGIQAEALDGMCSGIRNAAKITGLHGRWETLNELPYIVCDTGHNAHGFALLGEQIAQTACGNSKFTGKPFGRLVMIFGVVADKDLNSIADFLPPTGKNDKIPVPVQYYFVNAKGSRALPAEKLQEKMKNFGFDGEVLCGGDIEGALNLYINGLKRENDFVFIGGSTFVVAEALNFFQKK